MIVIYSVTARDIERARSVSSDNGEKNDLLKIYRSTMANENIAEWNSKIRMQFSK